MVDSNASIKNWLASNGKVISLLLTMLIGGMIPQAHILSFMVQYLLMIMLFFAFLDLQIDRASFKPGVIKVLVANLVSGFIWYFVFSLVNHELAMTAFITAIAPTAISSTVIISFIHGKVDFMVTTVLLTNILIALVLPFVIPQIVGANVRISTWDVLWPVLITMFVPLILAKLTTLLKGTLRSVLSKGKKFSFAVWLFNLFIISAKASIFVRNEGSGSLTDLMLIAGMALLICLVNFILGAILGGREYWQESSQALGQKNNTFAIWIALTFINPLAAMGPTIYILYHNLYNTWQIYRFEKKQKESLWKKQISA